MTPAVWNMVLATAVPAALASEHVAREVRTLLDSSTAFLSTTELADRLYPPEHARGEEGQAARRRLFNCLRWLAGNGMSDYATRGEPRVRKRYGRQRLERPIIWHAPVKAEAARVCPNCGFELEG